MTSVKRQKLRDTLGIIVKNHRKKKGWSQKILAQKTKMTPSLLSRIERGEAAGDLYQIICLERAFGINSGSLSIMVENRGRLK